MKEDNTIQFDRHGFIINGKRKFLLIGTVAYFRLHREDWRSRLEAVKVCGFNGIDIYVPWNYHEMDEGSFDFSSGNRDIATYLQLCQELGLWVYFRPGPYICNEWDGGGLPAWLSLKPEVRLRQNEPNYLRFVKRYLGKVNEIAQPFLHSRGGPIILYAIENELDFLKCDDVPGYMSGLRDIVRADGIDVPVTACIGMRTRVRQAMGFVEGIIPSPNVYTGGMLEREAAHTFRSILSGQYRNGELMGNLPMFVTETHRAEDSLRRILAAGFKGLGPFNVCGGTHYGFWNATNNWGGYTYISSTIDTSSMVSFDGRYGENAYGARRLAGLLEAFEEQLLLCEPISSWDGGPECSNPELGAKETEKPPARIYSLMSLDGKRAFVFLWNGTEQPQDTTVSVGSRTFPKYSTLQVTPKYDHIVLVGLSLGHVGLPVSIAYSTAEVGGLQNTEIGARLVMYGLEQAQGEVCLTSTEPMRVLEGSAKSLPGENPGETVLIFTFEATPSETRIQIGKRTLTIVAMSRQAAGRQGLHGPTLGEPLDLLAATWHQRPMVAPQWTQQWEGEGREIERLGVLRGAGWYELSFRTTAAGRELILPHSGDILSIYLDDQYIGTYLSTGDPLKVALPAALEGGEHRLRIRAEIWGHSNFDEPLWPSARLGSLRGVWGAPTLDGQPLSGTWRFAPEPPPPHARGESVGGLLQVQPGQHGVATLTMKEKMPRGAVITLVGIDCHGELLANGTPVCRYILGPQLAAKMVAGPADRFFIPGAYLQGDCTLTLTLRGVSAGAKLTKLNLQTVE
jgi:beta-galactosidase